ncbi:MAG: YihY/virulence factor BrkB family protein [Chthoniobacter sp.]
MLSLFIETFQQWNLHKAPKMGAALAYYAVLSLAPLVILVLSIMSLLVQRDAARAEVVGQFASLAGQQGAAMVDTILTSSASPKAGVIATVVGFVVLLIGASGAFGELQDSLNQIWGVPVANRPWTAMIKDRLLSFAMVFVIGFLLLISLVLSAGLAAASKFMQGYLPATQSLWELTNAGLSFVVVTVLFALIFRVLPDRRIAWRDVWVGAGITALLFTLGKFLIGLYLGQAAVASSYGAAGSLIIILLWTFYSAQILFFGAEFTQVFARRYGTHQGELAPTPTVSIPPRRASVAKLS